VSRLILLTQREFADTIARPLAQTPGVSLQIAATLPELEAALAEGGENTRLISFGSGVIVPAAILNRLRGPAYNFHPGPPDYPGIFPSVFALYDGAQRFGVTLHEMVALVDSGPIVAVDTFDLVPSWDRLALDTATFTALLHLLKRVTPQLADVATPLPRITEAWRGIRRSRKDFDALCRLPQDTTAEEFARRYRAVGEGPEHALNFTRFGRTFRLESRGQAVVRGGQPAKAV
jgi:methionyl-tRNA formyltransferase